MRLLLKLVLITLISLSPVRAGFFDDLFGSSSQPKDKGPFYITVIDQLDNNDTISTSERTIKIRLFYLKKYLNTIESLDNVDLKDAFNNNLTVRTQFVNGGPKTQLGQNLSFKIKNIREEDSSKKYNQVVFESTDLIIDEAQKLFFTFDVKDFADDINVSIVGEKQKDSEKNLRYYPIIIERLNAEFQLNPDGIKAEGDAFSPQLIVDDFQTEYDLDLNTQVNSFELYRNKKLVNALAKKTDKKFKLDLAFEDLNGAYLQENVSGGYEFEVPVSIEPANIKQLKFFQRSKTYSVRCPVEITTATTTGLEVVIKILARGKLSD